MKTGMGNRHASQRRKQRVRDRRRVPAIVPASLTLLALAAVIVSVTAALVTPARAAFSREYEIKAAFLYNFVKFVDWPAQALPQNATFTIGVLGSDPFEGALETINGKVARDHTIVVRRLASAADAADVQMLFVSPSERARFAQILASTRSAPVLTVSETPGFAEDGGVINFTSGGNRVRFEINVAAAQRAHLAINSQLLRLAKVTRA